VDGLEDSMNFHDGMLLGFCVGFIAGGVFVAFVCVFTK